MAAVTLGERNESGPVEVDTIVMNKVGILVRVFAACAKPYLSLIFVDLIDISDNIFAPGDLVLEFAGPGNKRTTGYEATILYDLCVAILTANDQGVLKTDQELRYARSCDALIRSFAKVGIIALIDDANVRSDKPRHEGGAFFMSASGRYQPLA